MLFWELDGELKGGNESKSDRYIGYGDRLSPVTSSIEDNWAELATQVRLRMKSMRLTQQDVQARGGPSTAKLREVLNGRTTVLSHSLRRGLESVVEWPAGTVDRILAGEGLPEQNADGEAGTHPDEPDYEFTAMQQVASAVEALTPSARRRVLIWALDRYGGDAP